MFSLAPNKFCKNTILNPFECTAAHIVTAYRIVLCHTGAFQMIPAGEQTPLAV